MNYLDTLTDAQLETIGLVRHEDGDYSQIDPAEYGDEPGTGNAGQWQ